jgi:parvulin-like peptidyl-prolyl isomerase
MMPPQFRSRYETPEGKQKLLERAVQMSLLSQEARRLNLDKKEDIARRIKEMADQFIVQELTKQEVMDKIIVSDADMLQHYNQNKSSFAKEEKVRVSLIMFEAKDNATQQVKDQKKNMADQAFKRVKAGEDFEAVAKEVSEDTRTKSRGGNAGLFARGKRTDVYGDVFEQKAFSLPLDAVSDVFQAKDGYYIIKVMEKKAQEQETFDEVKQRIERTLKTEKQKTAMESYLEGLKKRYPVKMLDESKK